MLFSKRAYHCIQYMYHILASYNLINNLILSFWLLELWETRCRERKR